MAATQREADLRQAQLRSGLLRVFSIADLPTDDDDTRLRRHVGVAAGFITIVAPLSLPLEAPGPIGVALALGLSVYSAANLAILARTKAFDRYVIALIGSGPIFVFATNAIAGGVTTSGGASVWTFLTPAYAILALGPRRATPWLVVFLVALLVNVAFDPVIRTWFPAPPYVTQLAYYAQNVGVPLTITFVLLRYTDVRRRAAEARSDELLTNAIPRAIADRLRHGESRIAEAYPETTVVFTDVVGFTPWAAATDPARVVTLLDDLFSRFDAVAAAHGMEKIKTVGDAYMAVAGAPEPRPDHAACGLAFAQAALAEVASWRVANDLDLEIRVGIASGPAVGGVIGRQRLLFDLWGATVNAAARMESSGVPSRIQLTASTRERLGGWVAIERREVDVKGLGPMTTYLVAET
ncbi:MAG TPA: adenylate/guanylate cyclase domain-containing protein [Candidatus Limnocylindrales bacterium]|nr:adenylate/guanylate cyclase domain-containing protein [Candidatus Limnocylindrales bacterium]